LKHLERLTIIHESRREDPWSLHEAPEDFVLSAARYVVGIEITITDMVGKFQASQQYKKEVREEIIAGLRNEPSASNTTAVAQMMSSRKSMHDAP
jgi:transcriptional regulator